MDCQSLDDTASGSCLVPHERLTDSLRHDLFHTDSQDSPSRLLTADYVKTDAVAAVKKFHICQIQVTLNYHGEVLFLDIRIGPNTNVLVISVVPVS